jgi:hypothetical protein
VEVDVIHVVESPSEYYYSLLGIPKFSDSQVLFSINIREKSQDCEIIGVIEPHVDDVTYFHPNMFA